MAQSAYSLWAAQRAVQVLLPQPQVKKVVVEAVVEVLEQLVLFLFVVIPHILLQLVLVVQVHLVVIEEVIQLQVLHQTQ